MRTARPGVFSSDRSIFLYALLTLFISSCGLGMDSQERLDRAQQAFDDGEYRAAIIDAKNVLLDDPENAAARLLLGRASVEDGDGISAEKELRRAVELGVDKGTVLPYLGRALLMQGKFQKVLDEIDPEIANSETDRLSAMRSLGEAYIGLNEPATAREKFIEVLAVDAEDIDAQLGVVQTYVSERNYIQARETLNQVLLADADHVPSWLASGVLSLRMGNAARAVSDYRKAADLAREHEATAREMYALTGLTDALLVQGSADEAGSQLTRMQELAPDDTRTLLVAARLASMDRDWPKAQELLQEILRRAPEFRQAQMLLGYVHKESGNLGQAEMYLSAVVTAVPQNANARKMLAETRLQMNRAEEARKALDPLISAPNADIGSLSMAAGASLVLGEFDAATDLMERVVAADPGNIEQRIQLALAYFRAENPAKAQEVLEGMPENLEGTSDFRRNSLLVLTKMAQGNREEALADAQDLLQRWQDRPDAHNLVGSIQMSIGNYTAARSNFEAASGVDATDLHSVRFLAQLDVMEGDFESATARYKQILEAEPDDTRAMVALARIAARRENHDEARNWLEKARASDPGAVEPRRLLGVLHLAFGEFADAETVIAEALELQPDNPKLLSLMGHAKLGEEDTREAEFDFGRAMQLEPNEPSHRMNLAKSQASRGNTASAIVTLEDNLEQTMQHVPSAVYLAALKADAGDLEGALVISSQLRAQFPGESAPYALEGELRARSGDPIRAAAAYEEALNLDASQRNAIRAFQIKSQAGLDDQTGPLVTYLEKRPADSNMRLYLAQTQQNLGERGKANTQYESVLQAEPDNFVAANNLAWNYFLSGDSRAEGLARRAYALQPDNSSVVDTLGWILVKKGNLEEGVTMLRDAVEKSSGRPDIRFHLAAALVDAGEVAEAKSILEEVLSGNDTFASRKEAEELLASL